MHGVGTDERGRAVVLVTGMSGTGKSTVLRELARRGHAVVDTDDPGWIVGSPGSDTDGPDGPEPLWDLDRMAALVEQHRTGWLFIAGCVMNQGAMYHRMDAVVLLSAPVDVLLGRVTVRSNPFGSTPGDRAMIVADHAAFQTQLRAGATDEIVTTVPVEDVVRRLEEVARSRSGGRPIAVPL